MKKIEIVFGLLLTAIIINMSYLDLNFNEFLTREAIPQATDPLVYDQNFPDFSADKIQAGEMSFDRLEGGTLKLGGMNNTNGMFSLADDAGVEKITMDKEGIVINDGQIIVKNSSNQSILDANGLVSDVNFKSDSVTMANAVTTTLTEYSDLDAMILTTPNLVRDTKVLILFTTQLAINSNDGLSGDWFVNLILNIDGVDQSANFIAQGGSKNTVTGDQNGVGFVTPTIHKIAILPSGIHTIKIRWKVQNNTATGKADSRRRTLSYLILGN